VLCLGSHRGIHAWRGIFEGLSPLLLCSTIRAKISGILALNPATWAEIARCGFFDSVKLELENQGTTKVTQPNRIIEGLLGGGSFNCRSLQLIEEG